MSDGGPAFPITAGQQVYAQGMRLRDYAAVHIAAAMVGGLVGRGISTGPSDAPKIAEAAWFVADAMLAAKGAEHG